MAHESFENEEIAAVMNDLFINIKVDREERPDIDNIYQSALALMGQQGGWPLTMFLTPDGEPFWGGTYFPSTARYGRPGFPDLLRGISEAYNSQPETIQQNVLALRDGLSKLTQPPPGNGVTIEAIDETARMALRMIDAVRGGTTGAPKFPQPIFFRFLWRAYKRTKVALFRTAVTTTLDAMAQGGIYDHVGGGFARYSTDELWLAPHFEKMLYDNALLIDLMSEVWQDTGNPLYEVRIRETIDWALREMRVDHIDDGTFAFASALDADSEGVEGKFYVWSEAEIDSLLGSDSTLFKQAYDVTAQGNWEGTTILNRSKANELGSEAIEAALAESRTKLLAARALRIRPGRDDKVLADWNGLMIAALANASAVYDDPSWLDAAKRVFSFVINNMEIDGRLRHAWCAGRPAHAAVIDDYANMIRAAVTLYEVTGNRDYLAKAENWVETADRHYWDDATGGYFLSADETDDVITRPKTVADNATPSGNGIMAEVLARLFHLTGNDAYRQRADHLIQLFSGDSPQYLFSIPGLLTSYELLAGSAQIAIIGNPDDPATQKLRHAVFTAAVPLKIVSLLTPDQSLPEFHPAREKGPVEGRPTAYVCVGSTCGLPVTDPADLRRQLSSL